MTLAIDLSNHQGAIAAAVVAALRAAGVEKVIVGLQYPGEPYPVGVAHQQLQTLIDGGMPHLEVYFESTPCDRAWGNVAQFAGRIERAWVACETGSAFEDNATIDAALAFADALNLPKQAGIYSAAWWWNVKMAGSWYSGRPLWVANYDEAQNIAFAPFGGWTSCDMKQFSEHFEIPGVGFEVDASYYQDEPAAAPPAPAQEDPHVAISPPMSKDDGIAVFVKAVYPQVAEPGVAIIPQETQESPPRRVYRVELPMSQGGS